MKRACLFALFVCALLGASTAASAESRSISYSTWNVIGQSVYLRFIVPAAEARRIAQPGAPAPTTAAIAQYLVKHVGVSSSAGACPAIDQGEEIGLVYILSSRPDQYRFEIVFQCQQQKGMTLSNAFLFDRAPQHVNFARVQIDGGGFVTQVFTSASEQFALPSAGADLSSVGILYYLRAGAGHIVHSLDRLCFVLALLLVRYRRQHLGYLIGGVSLGYLVALAVISSGLIVPQTELTEALIGFMIVLVAAEAASRVFGRPWVVGTFVGVGLLILAVVALLARGASASLVLAGAGVFAACYMPISSRLADRPAFGLVPAMLFGILDGFGFAADLSPLKLSARDLVPMQLGVDSGAVLAVTAVASAIVATVSLARARGFGSKWPTIVDLSTATLAGLGIFWFVGRLYLA